MIAAGAYLRTLREGRRLSRADVASQAGTNEMQIIRIEKGEIDTRSSLLMKLVRAVQGNPEHIAQLLTTDEATVEDGQILAQGLLTRAEMKQIDDFADSIPNDQLVEALAILHEMERENSEQVGIAVRLLRALRGK